MFVCERERDGEIMIVCVGGWGGGDYVVFVCVSERERERGREGASMDIIHKNLPL